MSQAEKQSANRSVRDEAGVTLVETMVALTLMLVVSAGVMQTLVQFSWTQSLVFARSAMHDGVRSATELLQQEVGQAGSVSLPAGTKCSRRASGLSNRTPPILRPPIVPSTPAPARARR